MASIATNPAATELVASQHAGQSSGQDWHDDQRTPSISGSDAQGANTASPSGSAGTIGSRINIVV